MRFSFSLVLAVVFFISSCNKRNADDWVGTYNGLSGQAIQRVIVEKVNNTTLKIQLQTQVLGLYMTYAIIGNAKIGLNNKINVNEEGTIAGDPNTFIFKGSGTLSGATLTLTGTATNKSNPSDVRGYSFTGTR